MSELNPHYSKVVDMMGTNKDSIFEPSRVLDFDTKTLMATTYGIRSKAIKKNVIVLFPSMFLNTGIITFPVKDSVGLLFAGVDNESYLLPAQYFPPVKEARNSVVKTNASPSQFDELLHLENLEAGEVLSRSLGGSQVYIRNTGDVELATSKMHRLSLNEVEGSLETIVERIRQHVGYSEYFNGVYDPKVGDDSNEHHIHATYFNKVPDWETDEVLSKSIIQKLIDSDTPNEEIFPLEEVSPIAKMQMVNVYNEQDDNKKKSSVDNEDLFYDFELSKEIEGESEGRFKAQLSKDGALHVLSHEQKKRKSVDLVVSKDKFNVLFKQGNASSSIELDLEKAVISHNNNVITLNPSGTTLSCGSASLTVTPGNEIVINDRRGSRSLSSILERIERLEALAHNH